VVELLEGERLDLLDHRQQATLDRQPQSRCRCGRLRDGRLRDQALRPVDPAKPLSAGEGVLAAVQHAMPGVNPYGNNVPQLAQEHYYNKPFFMNFPFGYLTNDANWFEAAGVPFAAYDDAGRRRPHGVRRHRRGCRGAARMDARRSP
jgi:hypothetical protein